jgi:CheY-like chemotaxis protein
MDVDERILDGLDSDERDICGFLAACRDHLASAVEIARKAGGKRRFREDAKWAVRVLFRLVDKGVIEADAEGHYRLRSVRGKDTPKDRLADEGAIEWDANSHYVPQSLLEKETPKDEQHEREAWSCRGKKILFVDDDEDLCEAVAQVLQDAGGEVSTAMDASDALIQLYDTKLDLIILALDLSGEDGLKLMKTLKRSQPGVPVILYTGLNHEDDAILAMLAGKRPDLVES